MLNNIILTSHYARTRKDVIPKLGARIVIRMVKCKSKSQQRQQFVNGGSVCTKTLMDCVELGRTLFRMVNPDAFLFKATKVSETTK
jgi:hypothetical protein